MSAASYDAVQRLDDRGFRIGRLAAGEWSTEQGMHRAVAAALRFPDYYGHNLSALNDCLGDVVFRPYDQSPEGTGLVLSFTDYDLFAAACPGAAQRACLASSPTKPATPLYSTDCLVHSNDPHIEFEPVGAMPVMWNNDEWPDAKRR